MQSAARPGLGADAVHVSAQFVIEDRVLGPVNQGRALLFNTSDPVVHDMVEAMATGSASVSDARRVCEAYIPGQTFTIGSNGSLDFDFVPRANYVILVCSRILFAGKPTWVSAMMPIDSSAFTADHTDILDMPQPLDVRLDPYAQELKAVPSMTLIAAD